MNAESHQAEKLAAELVAQLVLDKLAERVKCGGYNKRDCEEIRLLSESWATLNNSIVRSKST